MSVPTTCPYCNAVLSANPPAGSRVVCPRCGEAVGNVSTSAGPIDQPARPAAAVAESGSRSSRRVVVAVLLVLLSLGAWAVSKNWHRLRSPFGGPTPPAKAAVVKPVDLPGLGYLPESTEAVLAVQMPFLLERLGPEADRDPARALVALGLPESAAELLDQASGVGLKNVDQLVVGLGFESHALPPQVVVVVHARQPFDLDGIAQRVKARAMKREGRTLYVAKAGALPGVYWWKAADRVLVATLLARDLNGIPASPAPGIDHLRPALANVIRDRVADDACAWFAATSDKWDQYIGPYTFLPGTPLQGRTDLIKPAERLRTIAVSVPHDPERAADMQIGVKSADAGAELRSAFAERFRGEPVEVTGEEEWARLQLPNDPGRIGTLIGRLMADGK